MRLIIATKNYGKLKEIKHILSGIDIPVISLNELDKKFNIKENGKSFAENAAKKAVAVSNFYNEDYVLGEDSGLQVDYLGGAPGVYSKRYSGKNATDRKNNLKLLEKLKKVKFNERTAVFCCCLALAVNGKLVKVFEGELRGKITDEMKGDNGFGYDPVFYVSKYKKTAAQLPLEQKNKISHRAKAFNKLRKYLMDKKV